MTRPDARSALLLVAGVAGLWISIGVMMGMQATVGAALQGGDSALGPAVRAAFVQTVPWIPVTLLVVGLAVAFPLLPGTPVAGRSVLVHVLAVPIVAFLANGGVVLGFWASSGGWRSWSELASAATYWTVLRIHVGIVLYLAIAGVTWGVLYARRLRSRELALARREGQLAVARLHALTAQLRPHFLFNTLHTIGQLWRSGRGDDGDAMLDHLGALFQRVNATADRTTVPLEEELDMVEDYLAIERVRFRDRLHTTVSASPESLECEVPPLILQPLVENAVRHGIAPTSTAGCVRVDATVLEGFLVLRVADDGRGFGATPLRPTTGSGTGLANVEARLGECYPRRASLERSTAGNGGGTVTLRIPTEGLSW